MPELPAPHAPVASPSAAPPPFAPRPDRPVPDAGAALRPPLADVAPPRGEVADAPAADAAAAAAPLAAAQVAALFDAAPAGLAFFDRACRFVRVNAALAAMNEGRPVADHLGRRPGELHPGLAPVEAMLQRVLDTGRAVHGHEWDALETTGRAYRATYFPVPGPSDDGPAGVGVIVEDVTTARIAALDREFLLELSAALQLAADSAGVAAAALSRVAARLGLARCALYEITDAAPATAHCRHAWAAEGLDAVGEGAALPAEGFAALFEEALAGRVSVHPDPRHDPALPRDVRALCIVPLLRQGRLAAALVATDRRARRWTVRERGLLRTVAERVWPPFEAARLLEAEQRARVAAESANVAKSRFLATMSHELRTPLNAIAGHAELLQMGLHGPVTTAQEDALARIQRSQRHLLALIDDVLQYARLEGGRMTYRLAPIALGDAAHEAARLVAPVARARDIALDVAPLAGPDAALGDAEKVRQIAHILLSNAIKFTPPGGRIAVTVAPADPGDGADARVALRVADTGLGIAAERLADVFEPFVQVDGALTRTREGTGLGLAIARDLARGMGGELTVDSAPGVGSAFTLLLPPVPREDG